MAKVAFYTLGCKVNQYETEAMVQLFKQKGYEIEEFQQKADVYIINSCTVTNESDRKSRQMIRRAVKQNPGAVIAVAGCYAQIGWKKLKKITGLDLIIGTKDRGRIVELVEEVLEKRTKICLVDKIMNIKQFEQLQIAEFSEKTRAYVKIQDGCSQFCSYCIIPYVRGPIRSRPLEEIIAEVDRLAAKGYREIVLTGIHLGSYGTDLKEKTDLSKVIKTISIRPQITRIRLSSIDSNDVSDRLIDTIKSTPKFCRHLHIPLQSGDNVLLKRMNRHYTVEQYKQLIEKLREQIPGLAITTDLIVGFPGESEEQFNNICQFVQEISFSRMHIFPYSSKKGTPAADFPDQIKKQTKEKRSRVMHVLAKKMAEDYARAYLGKTVSILVEGNFQRCSNLWQGLTDTYLRVVFNSEKSWSGQMVELKIIGVKGEILQGQQT